MVPEWVDATFVLVGSILCVVAYRYGAEAGTSVERRDAVARDARLLTSGALAASSAGAGTIAADGTAPTATLLLFGAAGIALACGFTMRLGCASPAARSAWPPPRRRSGHDTEGPF